MLRGRFARSFTEWSRDAARVVNAHSAGTTMHLFRRRIRLESVSGALPIVTLAVSVSAWEVLVRVFNVPGWLLPAPTAIARILPQWAGVLAQNTLLTLEETLLGFALSVALGVLFAMLIAYSAILRASILPPLVVLQAMPKVALAPLLLIWVGYGLPSTVVIAFLIAFFPIVLSTATGLTTVEPELIELSRSLSASEWQTLRKIRFPSALPHFFSGAKVAVTLALIGAVIGEFVGAQAGLGYMVVNYSSQLRTDVAFAAILALSLLGFALFYGVELLERMVSR